MNDRPMDKRTNRPSTRPSTTDVRRDTFANTHTPIGRETQGLYPEISRTKLAKLTGKSVSGITGILNGRHKPTLELAGMIAMAIGVTIDELWVRLEGKQRERLERSVNCPNDGTVLQRNGMLSTCGKCGYAYDGRTKPLIKPLSSKRSKDIKSERKATKT